MIIIKSKVQWNNNYNDIVFDLNNWDHFKEFFNPTEAYTLMSEMTECDKCGQGMLAKRIKHEIDIDSIPLLISDYSPLTFDVETQNANLGFFFPHKKRIDYSKCTVAHICYK